MTCVGLWHAKGCLVAVADDGGETEGPLRGEPGCDGLWDLLALVDREVGLDWELVASDELVGSAAFGEIAALRQVPLWVVPRALVAALRKVASLDRGPAHRTARMLARLPSCAPLRSLLRRSAPPADRRQQSLW